MRTADFADTTLFKGCGCKRHNFTRWRPNSRRIGEQALAQGYTVAVLQLVSVACKYDVFSRIRQKMRA